MNGFLIIGLILAFVTLILFVFGVATASPYNSFGTILLLMSILTGFGTILLLNEGKKYSSFTEPNVNQGTQCSQVQEETKPNVNENYNYNYNHNYNYDEGETTTTYNVQTTTEPCTCSNCLKERNTVPATTEPNTKCTCSKCIGQ